MFLHCLEPIEAPLKPEQGDPRSLPTNHCGLVIFDSQSSTPFGRSIWKTHMLQPSENNRGPCFTCEICRHSSSDLRRLLLIYQCCRGRPDWMAIFFDFSNATIQRINHPVADPHIKPKDTATGSEGVDVSLREPDFTFLF